MKILSLKEFYSHKINKDISQYIAYLKREKEKLEEALESALQFIDKEDDLLTEIQNQIDFITNLETIIINNLDNKKIITNSVNLIHTEEIKSIIEKDRNKKDESLFYNKLMNIIILKLVKEQTEKRKLQKIFSGLNYPDETKEKLINIVISLQKIARIDNEELLEKAFISFVSSEKMSTINNPDKYETSEKQEKQTNHITLDEIIAYNRTPYLKRKIKNFNCELATLCPMVIEFDRLLRNHHNDFIILYYKNAIDNLEIKEKELRKLYNQAKTRLEQFISLKNLIIMLSYIKRDINELKNDEKKSNNEKQKEKNELLKSYQKEIDFFMRCLQAEKINNRADFRTNSNIYTFDEFMNQKPVDKSLLSVHYEPFFKDFDENTNFDKSLNQTLEIINELTAKIFSAKKDENGCYSFNIADREIETLLNYQYRIVTYFKHKKEDIYYKKCHIMDQREENGYRYHTPSQNFLATLRNLNISEKEATEENVKEKRNKILNRIWEIKGFLDEYNNIIKNTQFSQEQIKYKNVLQTLS